MEALIHVGLLNALFAAILAVIVAGFAILCRRRPAVVHALWVLVLVKFLVPSVCPVEIPWWRTSPAQLDKAQLDKAQPDKAQPDNLESVVAQDSPAPGITPVDH